MSWTFSHSSRAVAQLVQAAVKKPPPEEDIGFKKYLKILWSSIGNEFLELKRINCHNPERLFIFKSPHEFKGFNITEDDIHSYINTGKIQIKEHVDHLLTVIKSKY